MRKKILLLLPVFMQFCVFVNAQNSFKISGHLEGVSENALIKIDRENMDLDSCYIKNGNFQLEGKFEESPTSAYLKIKDGEKYYYAYLFIGNENITINAKIEDFPYIQTRGSKYDTLRYEEVILTKDLNIERKKYENEIRTLRQEGKWTDSLQSIYWGKFYPFGKIKLVDQKIQEIEKKFIAKNINSLYALQILEWQKKEYPKSELENLIKNVKPEFKNTKYVKSINLYLKYPDLKIGDHYYDFTAFDSKGKKVKFSDFFNTKYVLLDFSTLYCGFCIEAIPELEKIKNKQKENLEIVTFYVDETSKGYKGLTKKHSENWNIIWDKKGRLGETYAKYKVWGTPTFYLFDSNGKFIKKVERLSEIDEMKF